jgi:hypothetical protein
MSLDREVFEAIQRREMEMRDALGGVATAFSSIDSAVDALGAAFTGVSGVWQVIASGMTVGPKVQRIEKLVGNFIEDAGLKEQVLAFCKELRPLIERRNAALHRYHMVLAQGILRHKRNHGRKIEIEMIELDEFTTLEAALIDIHNRYGGLFVDVGDHVWPLIQAERARERSMIVDVPVGEEPYLIDPESEDDEPPFGD